MAAILLLLCNTDDSPKTLCLMESQFRRIIGATLARLPCLHHSDLRLPTCVGQQTRHLMLVTLQHGDFLAAAGFGDWATVGEGAAGVC